MKQVSPVLYVLGFAVVVGSLIGQAVVAAPVCVWKMDEGSGDTITDSSGSGLNGSAAPSGSLKWVDGVSGKAVHLSPGARITQPNLLGAGLQEGTVRFWVRFDAECKPGMLLGKTNDMTNNAEDAVWITRDEDGRIEFRSYLTGAGTSVPMVSKVILLPDEWYHVAVTWGRAGRALYIDGVEEIRDPYPAALGEGSMSEFALGGDVAASFDDLEVLPTSGAPVCEKPKPVLSLVKVTAPSQCRQGDVVELSLDLRVEKPVDAGSGVEIRLMKNDHTMTTQWMAISTRGTKKGQTIRVGPVKFDMFDAPEGQSVFVLKGGHADIKGQMDDAGAIARIAVKGHR